MTIICRFRQPATRGPPRCRGRVALTSALLVGGVATALYTFTTFMARVVEGDLHGRWLSRRRERMLDELKQHFLICGFGRVVGQSPRGGVRTARMCPSLSSSGTTDRVQEALELGYLAVEADASNEVVLRRVAWMPRGGSSPPVARTPRCTPFSPRGCSIPACSSSAALKRTMRSEAAEGRRRPGHLAAKHRRLARFRPDRPSTSRCGLRPDRDGLRQS